MGNSNKSMSAPQPTPIFVSAQQLHDMMNGEEGKNLLIVDVRDNDREEEGWIPISHSLPTTELQRGSVAENEKFLENFISEQEKKNVKILAYHCQFSQVRGPKAAASACKMINKRVAAGLCPASAAMKVYVLSGGFADWRRAFPHKISV